MSTKACRGITKETRNQACGSIRKYEKTVVSQKQRVYNGLAFSYCLSDDNNLSQDTYIETMSGANGLYKWMRKKLQIDVTKLYKWIRKSYKNGCEKTINGIYYTNGYDKTIEMDMIRLR